MLASIRWRCIPAMSHDNDNARNDDDALLPLPLRRRRWDNGNVHCFAPGAVCSVGAVTLFDFRVPKLLIVPDQIGDGIVYAIKGKFEKSNGYVYLLKG